MTDERIGCIIELLGETGMIDQIAHQHEKWQHGEAVTGERIPGDLRDHGSGRSKSDQQAKADIADEAERKGKR
jgi:hypothetical protein